MNNNQTVIPSVKAKITWMNDDTSAPKKASASITIGNSFMVNGLSIVQGQKGLFVSMPQRVSEKDGQKKYIEVAHPINSEMRTAINNAVLNSYSQTLALSQQFRSGDQMQKAASIPEEIPFEDIGEPLDDEEDSVMELAL